MNLTVRDNLDLTATFTVTGSSGAGSVIATRFRGIEGPQTASSTVWSFTGDGASSPTTMIPGHYFFQAIQGGNTSPIVYQAIQDPTPAESVLCRNAVQDRIKLLALDGINNNVVVQFKPNDMTVQYPVVFVTIPDGSGETDAGGANSITDWGHPVRVLIADRQDLIQDSESSHFDAWRQQIRRAFDGQRLPGQPRVKMTRVEPGPIVVKLRPLYAVQDAYQLLGSELTIRCITRETKGFGS